MIVLATEIDQHYGGSLRQSWHCFIVGNGGVSLIGNDKALAPTVVDELSIHGQAWAWFASYGRLPGTLQQCVRCRYDNGMTYTPFL